MHINSCSMDLGRDMQRMKLEFNLSNHYHYKTHTCSAPFSMLITSSTSCFTMVIDKGIFGNEVRTCKQTEPVKEKADGFKGTINPVEIVGFLRNRWP